MKEIIKILTDPASNRLIQLIRTKGKMTIADILSEAPDVPRATVYRKIEKMLNADVIEIIDSHKVRGQIENVYAIKNIYLSPPKDNADGMEIMKLTLMQLFGLCDNYFKSDDADKGLEYSCDWLKKEAESGSSDTQIIDTLLKQISKQRSNNGFKA